MPNRILRDWTDSVQVDSLDWQAEVLFVRLIMKADDHGRFSAHPRLLRSLCFPLRSSVRESDITRWLAQCEKAGMIRLYAAEGKPFLSICKFGQQVRSRSKFPDPAIDINCDQLHTLCGVVCGVVGVSEGVCVSGAPPVPKQTLSKGRATEQELSEYCQTLDLPASDGAWLFAKWEGNGWRNGKEPIRDWKATVRAWQHSGYMASQKPNGRPSAGLDKSKTIGLQPHEMPKIIVVGGKR